MQHRLAPLHPRETQCADAHDIFDEASWLGGEAMIAPDCVADWRDAHRLAADECADPAWVAI
jgi:hypothetical protein